MQSIFTYSIKEQEKRHQIYEIVYTIMKQAQGPKKAVKRLNMDLWLINIFFALTRIAIMVFFYSGWFLNWYAVDGTLEELNKVFTCVKMRSLKPKSAYRHDHAGDNQLGTI